MLSYVIDTLEYLSVFGLESDFLFKFNLVRNTMYLGLVVEIVPDFNLVLFAFKMAKRRIPNYIIIHSRHVSKPKNLGGHTVMRRRMRRAAAAGGAF